MAHIDHIGIYVRIGIECPDGETKVPEQEHIAIGERIYDHLREQTTSDNYDGMIAGSLTDPDLMVEIVQPNDLVYIKTITKLTDDLENNQLSRIEMFLKRVPQSILTAYINGEFN